MNSESPLGKLLDTYQPFNELEKLHIVQLRQHLAESKNPYSRENLVAHTVADAFILSPDRTQVLMLVHAASGVWMSPGGHTDGNPDMLASALREATEETGLQPSKLKQIGGGLFDINVGAIPTRMKPHGLEPEHLHFDICFAFEVDTNLPLTINEESNELRWLPITEALEKTHPLHRRRIEKALKGHFHA